MHREPFGKTQDTHVAPMADEGLERTLRRLGTARRGRGVDVSPGSAFDALLDQRLKDLERQVEELKNRVNGLMFMLAGAVLIQVVLSFFR